MSRYCVLSCQKHLYECRDWNNEPTTDLLQSSIWPLGEDNTKKYKTRGIPWRRYRVSYVSCFYQWNIKTKQLQDNRSAETSVLWYCDIRIVLLPVRHKITLLTQDNMTICIPRHTYLLQDSRYTVTSWHTYRVSTNETCVPSFCIMDTTVCTA